MALILELVILGFIFIAMVMMIHARKSFQKKISDGRLCPPSFPSLPLVGSLPFFKEFDELPRYLMEKSEELGSIFTVQIFSRLTLILNTKEAIVDALVKHSGSFSGREGFYTDKYLYNLNCKGISMKQYDAEFKKYHGMALNILKEFGFGVKNLMEERILVEVENLTEYIRKRDGEPFDPKDLTVLVSSNIIKSIVIGRRCKYEDGLDAISHYVEGWILNLDQPLEVAPILRFLPSHRRRLKIMTDSHEKLLAALEAEYEVIKNGENDDCFVRRFLEKEGPDHDHEQLIFMMRDLISAGTDTSVSSLRFLFALLANHPNIQKQLCEEIDSVVPKERLPSLSDKSRLPYVEATLMEVWRLKTTVPLALAHLTLIDTQVENYFVPSGTVNFANATHKILLEEGNSTFSNKSFDNFVLPNLYAVHMNPKVWGDPEMFRPDRFLDKDRNVIGREKIMPFSVGRRSCLGEALAVAEFFLTTASLLQHFHIHPVEGQEQVVYKAINNLITVPSQFEIRFTLRSK